MRVLLSSRTSATTIVGFREVSDGAGGIVHALPVPNMRRKAASITRCASPHASRSVWGTYRVRRRWEMKMVSEHYYYMPTTHLDA